MGGFSIWHWIIVLAVVLILFGGGGKISRLMGDLGRGIKSFKAGIKDEDKDAADVTVTRATIEPKPTEITGTATRADGQPTATRRDEPVRG
jgi:sec-independent protein translocase protein TatA